MCDRSVFIECPTCGGERGWETEPYGIDRRDGSLLTHWITCNECNATGGIEAPVELIDEFDLDEIPMPV